MQERANLLEEIATMDMSVVSSAAVPLLLSKLREIGKKIEPEPRIDPASALADGIAMDALISLANDTASAIGDSFLGLRLGAAHTRGLHGALEMACSTAPTLGAACERIVGYVRIVHPAVELTLTTDGELTRLERQLPETHSRHAGRHVQEFVLATIVQVARSLSKAPLRCERVALSRRKPANAEPLQSFFGSENIDYECETIGLTFRSDYLALPCHTSDPAMLSVLDRYLRTLLSHLPRRVTEDPVLGVREAIRARLERGAALQDVAALLALSARSLQRRLADAGTTYQQVLDEVRKKQALRFLENRDLETDEIAARLGYSESRAFLRAYKRWTGSSPSRHRRAMM